MWDRVIRAGSAVGLALLLGACAGPKYTVDDGRKVNEELLGQLRSFGDGERLLRPAIARSAALKDKDCDKQWELPFSVASSESWEETDRVAWVRALGVDERLTVVATTADTPVRIGQRIESVDGTRKERDAAALLALLADKRDRGRPFTLGLFGGQQVTVQPFEVCRGYTRLSPPGTPALQDYHWLMSYHPLELVDARPTDDEALWMVLWTQGLSEEGGARMKAYHYTTSIASTLFSIASIASGVGGAVQAAKAAAQVATQVAQSAATKMATDMIKQKLVDQARAYALDRLRGNLTDTADKIVRQQVVDSMQRAAVNRGALGGVARIGATVFDRADGWALERMAKLGASPLAGFSLHQKLAENGLAGNAFVFDNERMTALNKLASAKGLEDQVVAVLKGIRPEELDFELGGMPLASTQTLFSYDDPADTSSNPFARGLIDAMLDMPADSKGKK